MRSAGAGGDGEWSGEAEEGAGDQAPPLLPSLLPAAFSRGLHPLQGHRLG